MYLGPRQNTTGHAKNGVHPTTGNRSEGMPMGRGLGCAMSLGGALLLRGFLSGRCHGPLRPLRERGAPHRWERQLALRASTLVSARRG